MSLSSGDRRIRSALLRLSKLPPRVGVFGVAVPGEFRAAGCTFVVFDYASGSPHKLPLLFAYKLQACMRLDRRNLPINLLAGLARHRISPLCNAEQGTSGD